MELFSTHVSEAAIDLAVDVLRSRRLSEGAVVQRFEGALVERFGLIRPRAVNSGTAALHLALVAAGTTPGDEVLLPAQTFVATGLAILMAGAKPVFVDVDPKTGNMSPQSVRDHITDRTRAIMPVHWAGVPCEMDELGAAAHPMRVAIIEDAAHALGAAYKAKPIGSLSRFTCFSFQAIKHLTTGDGGAVCSLDESDDVHVSRLRWFGIDRIRDLSDDTGERQYNLSELGFKYHMNDLSAAVGLGNIASFSTRLARRREIADMYIRQLRAVAGLRVPDVPPHSDPAWWFFTLLATNRAGLMRKLREQGIPCSVVHRRIDRNQIFGGLRLDLPGQDYFDQHQFAVPCHEQLSDEDVGNVIQSIRSGW